VRKLLSSFAPGAQAAFTDSKSERTSCSNFCARRISRIKTRETAVPDSTSRTPSPTLYTRNHNQVSETPTFSLIPRTEGSKASNSGILAASCDARPASVLARVTSVTSTTACRPIIDRSPFNRSSTCRPARPRAHEMASTRMATQCTHLLVWSVQHPHHLGGAAMQAAAAQAST
jgi:hypothetical protein